MTHIHAHRNEKLWQSRVCDIAKHVVLFKFSSALALRQHLLATGERLIAEAAPNDQVWGIGLDALNPDARQPLKWKGANVLGWALMEARNEITASTAVSAGYDKDVEEKEEDEAFPQQILAPEQAAKKRKMPDWDDSVEREESAVARAVDDAGCGWPFFKEDGCDGTCGGLHCKGNAAALHYVETEYFAEMSELRCKAPAFRDDEHDQEDKREISRRLKLHLEELRKSHGKQWLDHVESIHRAMKSDRASAWQKRSCQGGVSSSV